MSETDSEPIYLPGLTLQGVEWATYCKLRDNPAHDRMRMTSYHEHLRDLPDGAKATIKVVD
jgi:hypothetical protein